MMNDLQVALNALLETAPTKNLARTADDLSQRYRAGHAQDQRTFLHSRDDVIAYAAFRLPATFAAVHAALVEVAARRPGWQPRSLLDVGAGPGTAMWAAAAVWPELERVTLLERDQHMITFGKALAQLVPATVGQAPSSLAVAETRAIREATWQRTDLTQGWECAQHDLVIGAYMLGELPLAAHEQFINKAWSCASDTLLIVEPGTPRGFALVRSSREQLLAAGAATLAPCPHDQPCPMPANDWCHFAQRVSRSRLHRTTKGATLSYEDEKFSYAAMTRVKGLPISGRVLRHPQKSGGHLRLELCTPEGLQERVVTRSNREVYHAAQDLRWGSALPD